MKYGSSNRYNTESEKEKEREKEKNKQTKGRIRKQTILQIVTSESLTGARSFRFSIRASLMLFYFCIVQTAIGSLILTLC